MCLSSLSLFFTANTRLLDPEGCRASGSPSALPQTRGTEAHLHSPNPSLPQPTLVPRPMPLAPPADLWDWHIYTHPQDMFNKRNEFNGRTPEVSQPMSHDEAH